MPKTHINITGSVMSRIEKDHIAMKPRWMFVAGSVALVVGVIAVSVFSIFAVSLMVFSLRTHGPMGELRYQQMISNFPWWTIPIALVGLVAGIYLLKRYDFSYRKNFFAIVLVFVAAIVLSGIAVDYFGFDSWARQGPMKGFYQKYDGGFGSWSPGFRTNTDEQMPLRGQGQGRGRFNGQGQ